MNNPLILIVNPGSASRKYALFEGDSERARLHFEWSDDSIVYTVTVSGKDIRATADIPSLDNAPANVIPILQTHDIIKKDEKIEYIGLRVVAPGSYFLRDHIVNEEFVSQLQATQTYAPLHVNATLNELSYLQHHLLNTPVYGISDSAFHVTKPDRAWNYGISLQLADALDIKRFGYHGISVSSAIKQISLPAKTIVCHLGSGVSVTAVQNGKSKDTTMGYSPLEGVIMSTRSGSLDISAANRLKNELQLDDHAFEMHLNSHSGLLGLGGSSDIRQLLSRKDTDPHARLALETYVYTLQKGIGQMAAVLNGADALIFTGTIGERSAPIRKRIISKLDYLGFSLSTTTNTEANQVVAPLAIHDSIKSKAIYIIPSQEEREMAKHILKFTSA